jgi:sensor domain CHASE-containing protein
MIWAEVRRLSHWEERHSRLLARIVLTAGLTLVVDLIGSVLMWHFERHAQQTDIHGFGDAIFFTTVQLLTVSSQLKNPVTHAGRVVDVVFELWALFVVTAVAGSFSSFFSTGDAEG